MLKKVLHQNTEQQDQTTTQRIHQQKKGKKYTPSNTIGKSRQQNKNSNALNKNKLTTTIYKILHHTRVLPSIVFKQTSPEDDVLRLKHV
jgi:hypothetical protein